MTTPKINPRLSRWTPLVLTLSAISIAILVNACGGSSAPSTPTAATPPPTPTPTPVTIDAITTVCPTAAQVAAINRDLTLVFDSDPTAGEPLACTSAQGSANLTFMQKRVYQALLAMQSLRFNTPLPFTNENLYTWLATTIRRIRFADVSTSFCCESGSTIVIRTPATPAADNTCLTSTAAGVGGARPAFWSNAAGTCGMNSFVGLLIHEARHNERKPHTCNSGADDATYSEVGAWAAQHMFNRWTAQQTGSYVSPISTNTTNAAAYRQGAVSQANQLCGFPSGNSRFCNSECQQLPAPTLAGSLSHGSIGEGAELSNTLPEPFLIDGKVPSEFMCVHEGKTKQTTRKP